MPNQRPEAIANEFLRRRGSNSFPEQMYIQKLTYIAHGWNLAILNEPLSVSAPEAWDKGPVFREIWDHIRDFGLRGPNCEMVDPSTSQIIQGNFSPDETRIIDSVWQRYGRLTGYQLSQMTHEPNTPWSYAYLGRGRNSPLFADEIRAHYLALANAGRA